MARNVPEHRGSDTMSSARFQVDPRLASILGENYRSTERALKELVDNAWDADAENVWIELPEVVSDQPVIVRDDGTGMVEREVRNEYLVVANDRRTRKGEITPAKKRLVKGRKGIGKFAGLVAANTILVETRARGTATALLIEKEVILQAAGDLEQVDLPVETASCDAAEHGTTITLTNLNQRLSPPSPEALRELLVLEYGREREFAIHVNGEVLGLEDIPGELFTHEADLPEVGKVQFQFKIMESGRPLNKAGIVTRVDGKVVGRPSFFGLDEREDFPKKLLNRVCGEINADGLEGDVTADWGALIENSTNRQVVQEWAQTHLHEGVEKVFAGEIETAQAQLDRKIRERLKTMPEHRRQFAEEALHRLMRKFYDLPVERRDVLVSLVFDAVERDEYWLVCQQIQEAKRGTIMNLADALNLFGLVTMTALAHGAQNRMMVLDALDEMALNSQTTELEIHKSLETNLWVLGPEYSLMSSNETLRKTIERYTSEKFSGDRANKRPDLLLAQDIPNSMLLIEFKKPSITLTREHQRQAKEYKDDLLQYFGGASMGILIIGGKVSPTISTPVDGDTRFTSYLDSVSAARVHLAWLLRDLTADQD